MWTQPYEVHLCPSLFKLQFILVQTIRRICDLPGINPRNHWDSCFKWLRSWSLTRWNYWNDNDWLVAVHVERDNSADWRSCSGCHRRNLRLFWLSAMSGKYQFWTSQSMGKQDQMFLGKLSFFWRFGSVWTSALKKEGSSSCRCTMTLIGEDEETKENVLRMLTELLSMVEDSLEDICHF